MYSSLFMAKLLIVFFVAQQFSEIFLQEFYPNCDKAFVACCDIIYFEHAAVLCEALFQ